MNCYKYLLAGSLAANLLLMAQNYSLKDREVNLVSLNDRVIDLSIALHSKATAILRLQKETLSNLQSLKDYQEMKYGKSSFRISSYNPTREECDSTPDITAINRKSKVGYTGAVGTDARHLLGKKVWIRGLGVFHLTDILPDRKGIDLMLSKRLTPEIREVRIIHD